MAYCFEASVSIELGALRVAELILRRLAMALVLATHRLFASTEKMTLDKAIKTDRMNY